MKKKIIIVFLSVALFLLSTSLSNGGAGHNCGPRVRLSQKLARSLAGHVWQDDIPNQSPTRVNSISNANVVSHLNRRDITIVVPITFGDYDLFLIQHKSESTSVRKPKTLSSEK